MHDLAIVVVSHNDADWLRPCLSSVFERSAGLAVDVVVADNGSDGAADLVERQFRAARALRVENRGFGHANNQAWRTCDARYVLFLNPDTEVVDGTFAELVVAMDARRTVGLVGVRQVGPDGAVLPTIRRFPSAMRTLGEALGSERYPFRPNWLGERELDLSVYSGEVECDWTSGSFMLARREALEAVGGFDERFFLYGEEPDLCLRIKQAAWEIRHLPLLTIVHHAEKAGIQPRLEAQNAYARRLHAEKHFSRAHRAAFLAANTLRYGLRALAPGGDRRAASRGALRTLLGLDEPPLR